MKNRLLIVVLLLGVASGVAVIWPRDHSPPGYGAITDGMTRKEVNALLGRSPDFYIGNGGDSDQVIYWCEQGDVRIKYLDGRVTKKEFHAPGMLDEWLEWFRGLPRY